MKAYRLLRADEIEVRISTCNAYGVGLLLYKDARVDMNLLDEVHGSLNWQNTYELIDGQLFCIVEVWDAEKGMWISKENVGVESYTEKEKGRASDAFKRACFLLGIGRELYSAPSMFVFKRDLKTLEQDAQGRYTCKDAFKVEGLEYDGDRIAYVAVRNLKNDKLLEFGAPVAEAQHMQEVGGGKITEAKQYVLKSRCEAEGVDMDKLFDLYRVAELGDVTEKMFSNIFNHWEQVREACS